MLLYHFTSHRHLPRIMEEGLTKGEAPLSDTEWLNAVNLTTDSRPEGHGLDGAFHVWTAEESAAAFLRAGVRITPGAVSVNKRAVRITLKLPSKDRNLKDWLPWARKRLAPAYLKRLVAAAGGGMRKAKTWKLYFGIIPPSAFVAVDILEPDDFPEPI